MVFKPIQIGLSGLQAFRSAMDVLAHDTANVDSPGYKQGDTTFSDLVTGGGAAPGGGVIPRYFQRVDRQGTIEVTDDARDLAIVGKGFFVVTDTQAGTLDAPNYYTRAGSFRPDKDGFLQNTAGFYLRGFRVNDRVQAVDPNGNIINNPDFQHLRTVNLRDDGIINFMRPTTEVSIQGRLPAEQVPQLSALTFINTAGREITFGTNGYNGTDTATVTIAGTAAVTIAGERIDLSSANNTSLNSRVGTPTAINDWLSSDLGQGGVTVISPTTNTSYVISANAGPGGFVLSAARRSTDGTTPVPLEAVSGVSLDNYQSPAPAGGQQAPAVRTDLDVAFVAQQTISLEVFDSLGAPHTVTVEFQRRSEEPNLWEARIDEFGVTGLDLTGRQRRFDSTNPTQGGVRFAYAETSAAAAGFTQRIFLKYDGAGSLQQVRTTLDGLNGTTLEGTTTSGSLANRNSGNPELPARLVAVAIGPLAGNQFNNGNPELIGPLTPLEPLTADNQPFNQPESRALSFEWNIGTPTDLLQGAGTGRGGLTETHSGLEIPNYISLQYSQNGARLGTISQVQVNRFGTMHAIYDNGLSKPIYQLPVATFVNPNGLLAQTGNVWLESGTSGTAQLQAAGQGNAAVPSFSLVHWNLPRLISPKNSET